MPPVLAITLLLPLADAQETAGEQTPHFIQIERRLTQNEQWTRLARHYQRLIRNDGVYIQPTRGGTARVIREREYCHARISKLPAVGLDTYRRLVDPAARGLLAQHQRLGRLEPLRKITKLYFNSSCADQALLQGGLMLMELGRFEEALIWLQQIAPSLGDAPLHYPGSRLDLRPIRQRVAYCLAELGDPKTLARWHSNVPGYRSLLALATRHDEARQLRGAWSLRASTRDVVETPWWREPQLPVKDCVVHDGSVYWRSAQATLRIELHSGRVLARYPIRWRTPVQTLRSAGVRTISTVYRWRQRVAPLGNQPTVIWPWLFTVQDALPRIREVEPYSWRSRLMARDIRMDDQAPPRELGRSEDRFLPDCHWLAPPTGEGDRIYLAGLRKGVELFCYDRRTLRSVWVTPLLLRQKALFTAQGTLIQTGSAVLPGKERVYWDSQQGAIICLDSKTGKEVWRTTYAVLDRRPRPPQRMRLAAGYLIAIPRLGRGMLIIDPEDGSLMRRYPLSTRTQLIGVSGRQVFVVDDRVRRFNLDRLPDSESSLPVPRLVGRPALTPQRILLPTVDGLLALSPHSLKRLPDRFRQVNRLGIQLGNIQMAGKYLLATSPAGLQALGPQNGPGFVPLRVEQSAAVVRSSSWVVPHASGLDQLSGKIYSSDPSGIACREVSQPENLRWKLAPISQGGQARISVAQKIQRRLARPAVHAAAGSGLLVVQAGFQLSGVHRTLGLERWRYELPGWSTPSQDLPRIAQVAPQLIVEKTRVIALTPAGELIALDRERGTRLWKTRIPAWKQGRLYRAGQVLAILSSDRLTRVDPRTGRLHFSRLPAPPVDFPELASPAGPVYLASRHAVRTLDVRNGKTVWHVPFGQRIRAARSLGPNLLIELERQLVLLDGRSGRQTLALPKSASATLVAADVSTRWLYAAYSQPTRSKYRILWLVGHPLEGSAGRGWRLQMGQTDRLYHAQIRALASDRCLLGTYSVDPHYSGLWLLEGGRMRAAIAIDQEHYRAPWPLQDKHWTINSRTLSKRSGS